MLNLSIYVGQKTRPSRPVSHGCYATLEHKSVNRAKAACLRPLDPALDAAQGFGKHRETGVKDFKGKTAFITGAASGIGLGMARAFGREGMNIVIADIDRNAAQAAAERLTAEQIKAVPVFIDVTERSAVKSAALDAV